MISIFVSSTFGDMQAERDALRQHVFPRLRQLASQYGESVRMVDLRWGVNTTSLSEEQATDKILNVCFEQIDKCQGRMICLLGNRYGWIPNYDTDEVAGKFGLKLNKNVSATELEIQYGILQRKNPQNAIVFMRDEIRALPAELLGNFQDDDLRLGALKQKLSSNRNCTCRHYSLEYTNGTFKGIDAFEELAYTSIREKIIEQLDVAAETPQIRTKRQFDAEIDSESFRYDQVPLLEKGAEAFLGDDHTFAILRADAGMGKTAFSAHICKKLERSRKVFYYFCGCNAECETPAQMLEYFIWQVSDYLKLKVADHVCSVQENVQIFAYLLNRLTEDVVILIDGMDHLVCSYKDRLAWLPVNVPDRVKFVLTTSLEDRSYERIGEHTEIVFLEIPPLENPAKFIKHLLQVNGKDIQDEILIDALSEHHIDNYYHAKMIAEALVSMDRYDFQGIKDSGDGIDAINLFLKSVLLQFPKEMEGVALFLLHDYGKRIAPDLVPELYIYIACIDGGLRASDLESLFGPRWDDLSFERYISFLSGMIVERENGCYDFSSSIIRKAVENLIEWKYRKKVIKHIETLPESDPLKLRCGLKIALCYERYDVAARLIENNLSSAILAEQAVDCLNYLENELSSLLRKHDLFQWFFENVITGATSVQEQEACAKIILNVLHEIPGPLKASALEFVGDDCQKREEYIKAEKFFNEALRELPDSDTAARGRLYYKAASAMRVNSEEDYSRLKAMLGAAVEMFGQKTGDTDLANRMYGVVAKYQLNMMELYHMGGIPQVKVFDGKMKLTDGSPMPYLEFVSRQKIETMPGESETEWRTIINAFNDCRRKSEKVYEEAAATGAVVKIWKLFALVLNGYDVFGIAVGRIERLNEVKEDVERELQKRFDLNLYKILGALEYDLAVAAERVENQKKHLLKCCSIWGQFIVDSSSLPDFTKKYIRAEMDLVRIFLGEKNEKAAEEHLSKWSQASYSDMLHELKKTFAQCSRYPDEVHMAVLDEIRRNMGSVNGIKTRIKYLGDNDNRCEEISYKYDRHVLLFRVFNWLDEFKDREKFSFENYHWLKDLYLHTTERLSQNTEDEALPFVCIYLLNSMLRMLDLVPDITDERAVRYDLKNYYNERVFVLEERHKYEMRRLDKIWVGFLYAKALMDQAERNPGLMEQNYLLAIKIFRTLLRILYEGEVTPFNLDFPMISRRRVNCELCAAETKLAAYYKEAGLSLSAAKTYETIVVLALSLFGEAEDFNVGDRVFVKLALAACLQASELFYALNMPDKARQLGEKYEVIKTLYPR